MSRLLVSVDLDDAWTYQRARGMTDWESAKTILPETSDAVVSLLDTVGIRDATMFAVGRDATTAHGSRIISDLSAHGYEIADHSWLHRGELPGLEEHAIHADLIRSRHAIHGVTGTPVGFRCPSFGNSPQLTAALKTLGYLYDASVLPTILLPALRAYHRLVAGRSEMEPTYGSLRTIVATQRMRESDGLMGIPVTTMPGLRLPVHGSYLVLLASRSPWLALQYLRTFDRLARALQLDISFLIHPTDLLDATSAPALGFFPGMKMEAAAKRALFIHVLRILSDGRTPQSHAAVAHNARRVVA